jgi:hypothetical protein
VTTFNAQVDAAAAQTLAEVRRRIISTAKSKHAEIMGDDPPPAGFVRHVDGVRDAPEEAVKADGVIVYDYDRLDMVASVALDTLRQLSPFDKGDYVRSHVLLVNGQMVDALKGNWKEGDEISITNLMPYTRKIEIGNDGYRAHPHVYEKAAQLLANRFGNVAKIIFTFRPVPFGDIGTWAKSSSAAAFARSHRGGNQTRHQDWLTNQPTIVIREFS